MTAARAAYLQSPESKQAAASDSLFKPFDSGSLDGNGPAKQVVVNVAGLQELRLVAICERGPANCNIWGEPKLIAKDGTVTRLTDLKPTSVSVGWGQLLVNKNWNDHPLIVGDRQFEFGFWVHANSELTFALDGKYERFEALVGEDKDRLGGLVRFKVLSTPVPLPASWADLARDFPLQAGWLRTDAGADGLAAWFGPRETGALEQEIVGTALRDAAADSPLRAELEALVAATAGRRRRPLARPVRPRLPCSGLCGDAPDGGKRGGESGLGQGTRRSRCRESAGRGRAVGPTASPRRPGRGTRSSVRGAAVRHPAAGGAQQSHGRTRLERHHLRSHGTFDRRGNRQADVPQRVAGAGNRPRSGRHRVAADGGVAGRPEAIRRAELAAFDAPLAKLQQAVADTPVTDTAARRALHHDICRLRRQIAFANPLLDFQDLVFIKRHRAFYHHMCDQFYGIGQNPGGGLYVLEDAFGPEPASPRRAGRLGLRNAAGSRARNSAAAACSGPTCATTASRPSAAKTPRAARSSRPRSRPTPGRSRSPTSSARAARSRFSTKTRRAATGTQDAATTCSRSTWTARTCSN